MGRFNSYDDTIESEILECFETAKEYLDEKDIDSALNLICEAKFLVRKISAYSLRCSYEATIAKVEAKILAMGADKKMESYQFLDALELIETALKLVPDNPEYLSKYKQLSELVVDTMQYKRKIEHQEWVDNEKKAEEHYQKALQYKESGNYQAALDENESAMCFAWKAGIRDNKYIILKNQIMSAKKSGNAQNRQKAGNNSVQKGSNADAKILQYIKDAEKYLINDDMKNVAYSLQMAKMLDKTNKFHSEFCKLAKKINQKLKVPEIDKLIEKTKKYISQSRYADAYKLIDELYDIIPEEEEEKINYLYDSVLMHKITPQLNSYIRSNNLYKALDVLKSFLLSEPENERLKNKIAEVETMLEIYNQTVEMYKSACKFFECKDYQKALSEIKKAIALTGNTQINIEKYKKLEKNISDSIAKVKTKQDAEKTYQLAKEIYENDNPDYKLIIDYIESVLQECANVNISSKEGIVVECSDLLKKAQTEYYGAQAETFYNNSLECYQAENYLSALTNIDKALKLIPQNNKYIDFRNIVMAEKKEYDRNKEFEQYSENGIQKYSDGQFEEAVYDLEHALKLKPDDIICQRILKKVKTGKIDIMTCSKQGLLTLGFISDEQAKKIIHARDEGLMWYNYQDFGEQFGISPDKWIELEEKILFPKKTAARIGRTLDL